MFKLPTDEEKLNFTYKGTVPEHEDQLLFDHRTVFKVTQLFCSGLLSFLFGLVFLKDIIIIK